MMEKGGKEPSSLFLFLLLFLSLYILHRFQGKTKQLRYDWLEDIGSSGVTESRKHCWCLEKGALLVLALMAQIYPLPTFVHGCHVNNIIGNVEDSAVY